MGEMTITELFTWVKDITLGTAVAIFIVQLWRGELIWRKNHVEVIGLFERIIAVLKEHHSKREADLERSLDKAEKRGDQWANMSVQQNKLVGQSLEVTKVVTTEKPPA
jgi:hypothetical protein